MTPVLRKYHLAFAIVLWLHATMSKISRNMNIINNLLVYSYDKKHCKILENLRLCL